MKPAKLRNDVTIYFDFKQTQLNGQRLNSYHICKLRNSWSTQLVNSGQQKFCESLNESLVRAYR